MTRRWYIVRRSLALTYRAAPATTVLAATLTTLLGGVAAGTGLSQRWLVDASGMHSVTGIVGAVALGVTTHTLATALERMIGTLRAELVRTTTLALTQEIMTTTTGTAGIEHLERPEYLNRLALLRRGAWSLAGSWSSALMTVVHTISLVLSLWLLASVHPALMLLVLAAIPTLFAASRARRLMRAAADRVGEAVRHEASLHDLCLHPESAKELRISNSGPELDALSRQAWERASRVEAAAGLRGLAWQVIGWACYVAGLAGALVIGANLVARDLASAGDVVLIVTLASTLGVQIAGAVRGVGDFAEAGRITEHYLWLREYARTQTRGTAPAPVRLTTGIHVRGLSFTYPGRDTPVLRDVDLDLPAGTTVGLVGVNGAGKTTLVKLLCGLYQPDRGDITVNGVPLREIDPAAWASRCSGTFQDFVKLQLPVRQVVGVGDLPRMEDTEAVGVAIVSAGADSVVSQLPDGRDTQLGAVFDGAELSHGQWQKLALARGLMRERPLLLVLDEPTAALDPQAEHELFETFAAHARSASTRDGAIVLLVSHRFSTMHMADHIIVLTAGEVAERGTHAELMAADGQYAALYTTQAAAYR